MSEYGSVFDTNDIKKYLLKYNRDYTGKKSWENLYNQVNLSTVRQLNSLSVDYSQAMSDAYATAYANKAAINSSNIGEGYKTAIDEELDIALDAAYDAYRNNYLSSVSDVENAANEATAQIDLVMEEEANNISSFAKKPYEYLQYLFDKFGEGLEEDNIFYNDELWKRYTNEEFDENGEVVNRTLKSWDEIVAKGAKDENGEWIGLYDADNRLTVKGADFFDQMLNYYDSTKPGAGLGFGSWLAENDPDLSKWSKEYNPYDYTEAGTHLGSFKTMFGLTSTDEQYSFFERFGGFTKKEVDTMYTDILAKAENLSSKLDDSNGKGKDIKAITEGYEGLVSDVKSIADDLGITDSLEAEMGMSFDELGKYLANLNDDVIKNTFLHWAGSGLATSATVGATAYATSAALASSSSSAGMAGSLLGAAGASSSVPVAGWIIAAVLAVTAGGVIAYNNAKTNKSSNVNVANYSRDAFNSLLTGMIEYSQSTRKQTQNSFYNNK